MRTVTFHELSTIDFSVRNIVSNTWYWRNGDDDDYRLYGRKQSLFIFLVSGQRDYIIGETVVAHTAEASFLFIPDGLKYLTKPICPDPAHDSFGYNIGFDLYDENGETLYVDEPFKMLIDDEQKEIFECCYRLDQAIKGLVPQPVRAKAEIYALLDMMCPNQILNEACEKHFGSILPAIRHIQAHPEMDTSIEEMCIMCKISESSFRRMFRQYSGGISPIKYRNNIRIKKAEQLYRNSSRSIESVATMLGFCDAAHLCRLHKQVTGRTLRNSV